ncbi:MAG: PAC2 family protein [Candidatus Hodarchaeales archaeon]|jgi:predicted ATP-grasp superfamily ATP-dependent carboligase
MASLTGNEGSPRNIWVQGLTGMGLVGYHIAGTLLNLGEGVSVQRIQSYAEFFPAISFVDSGNLSMKSINVYRVELGDVNVFVVHGAQPQESTLSYFLLTSFERDMIRWNDENPVDLYLSFGALVEDFKLGTTIPAEEAEAEKLARERLEEERKMERKFFVATSEILPFDQFKLSVDIDKELLQKSEGYISGLNGVLPAYVGSKLDIPAATVMIQSSIPSLVGGMGISESHLGQYLGMCSSLKGLEFLSRIINYDIPTDALEYSLSRIEDLAAREFIVGMRVGSQQGQDRPPQREMYV